MLSNMRNGRSIGRLWPLESFSFSVLLYRKSLSLSDFRESLLALRPFLSRNSPPCHFNTSQPVIKPETSEKILSIRSGVGTKQTTCSRAPAPEGTALQTGVWFVKSIIRDKGLDNDIYSANNKTWHVDFKSAHRGSSLKTNEGLELCTCFLSHIWTGSDLGLYVINQHCGVPL